MFIESLWKGMKAGGTGFCFGCLILIVLVYFQAPFGLLVFLCPVVGGALGFILGFVKTCRTPEGLRAGVLRKVRKECERSPRHLKLTDHEVIRVGEDVTLGERFDQAFLAHFQKGKARVDHLQTFTITAAEGDFHLVIPWSGPTMLPHEFFGLVIGHLPSSVTLRRGALGSWSSGLWVGPHHGINHPLAQAAAEHSDVLGAGVEWNWEKGDYKIELQWGIQAVPLSSATYVHFAQTAPRGLVWSNFGIDWYLERWVAFFLFSQDLKLDIPLEKVYHFQPKSLLLVHRLLNLKTDDISLTEDALSRPGSAGDLL